MSLRARVALLGGVVVTVLLLPTFLIVVGSLVSEWTAGLGMHRMERGLLFGLAYLVTVPIALRPAWAAFKYAFSRPRHTVLACPKCRWSGRVLVTDASAPVQVAQNVQVVETIEIEGMHYIADPLEVRRERQQHRLEKKRRQAREKEHESAPNPDFDFRDR